MTETYFGSRRPALADEIDYLAHPAPDHYGAELFSLYGEVALACQEHVASETTRLDQAGLNEKVPPDYLANLMERETRFTHDVLRTVTEVVDADPTGERKVTLLLDIDETAGQYVPDLNTTIMRPSLTPLVNALRFKYRDRFEVGILSTRPQEHLETLEDGPLSGIRQTINPNMVISSNDSLHAQTLASDLIADKNLVAYNKLSPAERASLDSRRFQALGSIISHKAAASSELEMNETYHHKLLIMRQLALAHPDSMLVLADDLPAAALLDANDANLRGIFVSPASRFMLADDIRLLAA